MDLTTRERELRDVIFQTRIMGGALVMGVVFFAVITFVVDMGEVDAKLARIMGGIGLTVAIVCIFVSRLVPGLIDRMMGPAHGFDELLNQYRGRAIMRMAILEGAAFLNVLAYMLGSEWSIVVAGVLVIILLLSIPTRTNLDFWLENRIQEAQTGPAAQP